MDNGRRSYAVKKLMSAYTVLATLPGIPTIFYGDEAGLEGYSDPFNRMPYPWGKEETALISHYRALGEIRKNNSVYKTGDFKLILLNENLLIFSRGQGAYKFVTVLNNSSDEINIYFENRTKELIWAINSDKHTLSSNTAKIFKVKANSKIEIG